MRRAWIEITNTLGGVSEIIQSLSVRRAWIEIAASWAFSAAVWSLSVRRAWIEIKWKPSLIVKVDGRSP